MKQNRKWAGHAGLLCKGLNSLKSGFGLDRPTPRTSPAASSHSRDVPGAEFLFNFKLTNCF